MSKFENQISKFQKFGIKPGLERIRYILDKLDNPQNKFRSIHVAGTNGKGSVCAMLASILHEAGYKTGLYTSPHLIKYNERFKINGRDIGDDYLFRLFRIVQPHAKKVSATIFEILTAMAFKYFADQKVGFAVVEVGMGGRWDSTSVIAPEVSIITNVDFDHTEYLGKTIGKIAFEKAGIIKPRVPVITAEKKREALVVIKRICEEKGAKLIEAGSGKREAGSGLIGKHQRINEAVAVKAATLLGIPEKAIKRGMKKTKWPARFQILKTKPLIILDGAHNPAGARSLKVTIEEFKPPRPMAMIIGTQAYKDTGRMVGELYGLADAVIVTRSSNPNSLDQKWVAREFEKYNIKSEISLNPAAALKKARAIDNVKTILVCGSIYLVGDILSVLTLKDII